nr:MAG TPA: hypothetical protein [Bacteriophage sp.]
MVVLHLYCHFRQIDSLVNHSTFSRCLGRTSLFLLLWAFISLSSM